VSGALPPGQWSSIVEALAARALAHPTRRAYTFIDGRGREEAVLTYGELDRRVGRVAAHLRRVLAPGDRALLIFPSAAAFVVAFLGCLRAGVVAVPMSPPRRGRSAWIAQAIAADCGARAVLSPPEMAPALEADLGTPGLQWIAVAPNGDAGGDIDAGDAGNTGEAFIDPERTAFLQYTSGSTSVPKGVMVSHRNIIANQRVLHRAFEHTEASTVVGWAPFFHDQGLIGNVLHPLYAGSSCVLMSPLAFVKRPLQWLKAISEHRAHTSGGPNFAYDMCVRAAAVHPEVLKELDLRCWTIAFNGAEPVRADTLDRFSRTFAACGFRPEAFFPCYGLAEATLYATGSRKGAAPLVRAVSRNALAGGMATSPGPADTRALVGCGTAGAGVRIAIVDPTSRRVRAADQEGEIWLAGDSVAGGYWNRPDESRATFQARTADGEGPFLRTGDLGFLDPDGQLFVTGRIKDLIIVLGRNHYPQDIERSVEESHALLRPNATAAFTVDDDGGQARLIVVQELERDLALPLDGEAVCGDIRRAVVANHDLTPHDILLVKAGSIPKTTSGKIQRRLARQLYLAGDLDNGPARAPASPAVSS
jgi:acyl-CoA synthetase (AMP-forming)/AMP-acid ligase II